MPKEILSGWPRGASEMGAAIRAFDWARSPLGHIESWPRSLRTAVSFMLDSKQPVYVAWGPDLTSLYNDGFIPFLGLKHPALAKRYWDVWPEVAAEYRALVDRTLEGEAQYFIDRPVALAGRPGTPMSWFTFSWTPLRDDDDRIAGFLCSATETTEKVLNEQRSLASQSAALEESRKRFELTVEQVRDYAIFLLDAQGIITEWFPGAEAVFGWSAGEVRGKPASVIFTPEDREAGAFEQELATAAAEGSAPDVRWHLRKDGTRVFMEGRTTGLKDASGKLIGFVKIGQDVTFRRMTLERLQLSEERFRLALAAAHLGTWKYDVEQGTVSMDERAWAHYDLAPADFTLDDVISCLHPEDRGEAVAHFGRALDAAAREPVNIEYRVVKRNGEVVWLSVYGAFFFAGQDGAARALYGIGTTRDITSRKKAEQQLRESRAELERQRRLYEAILTNTPDLAYVFDLNHRFIYANEVLLRMWGRTREQSIGRNCLELGYEPWHAAMHDREIEQVVATRQPVRGEVPFAGTFGRRIYDYIFVPVLGEDGSVEAVAGTTRDVTERKHFEDELLLREERLRLAQHAGGVGAWEWHVSSDEAVWPRETREMFGHPQDGPVSFETWMEALHPFDRERAAKAAADVLTNGDRYEDEYRVVLPGGSTRWLRSVGKLERNALGEPVILRGVVTDITEQKAAEEKIGLLMREVNHRSKNLLSVVQAIATQTAAADEGARNFLRRFSDRLQGLSASHDLLLRNSWQGVELRALIESQLSHFSGLLGSRILVSGPALTINAAAAQNIGMALHELGTNAGKYGSLSTGGGSVSIGWSLDDGQFSLTWSERGGPIVSPPTRRGFGSRLITSMIERSLQGRAELDYGPLGLCWSFSAPDQCVREGSGPEAG